MYNEYFGFKEAPFSIAPDPRYLYMTAQHREALAHLVYGLNSEGGCILLTGEVGTGKTTICRCLLEQIPEQAHVALVLNPKVSEIELLETICDELHISYPDGSNTAKTYTDRIYKFLIESNRNNEKTVLIIDEAQNLDSKVLEQLRLLTNLETDQRKLLQIIVLGQPELLDILAKSEMRQLAQRITARFHLQPLTKDEVKAYVSHRLAVAGQNIQLFPDNSINLLYKLSNGIPRLINIISDRALLGTYVENQYSVKPAIIKKAAKEVFGELKNVEHYKQGKKWLYPLVIFSSMAIIAVAALFYFLQSQDNITALSPLATTMEAANEKATNEFQQAEAGTTENIPPVQPDENVAAELIQRNTEPEHAAHDSIDDILNNTDNDTISAYQALFNSWNHEFDSNSAVTACKQAEKFSLSCLHKQGNLNSLKKHNRPAVLRLVNKQGEIRSATITAIEDNMAMLVSGNTTYTIPLEDLDKYWFGQYVLLWKKPQFYSSAITPGDSGNIIHWLNVHLAKINNRPLLHETVANTYDSELVETVKAFQSSHGLTADGIIGPVTIIHINTLSDMSVPALIPPTRPSLTEQD